jgi:hypothetical protein
MCYNIGGDVFFFFLKKIKKAPAGEPVLQVNVLVF